MGSPLEVLANYNPTGFALANQQRQAQLAQTQAQTQGIATQTQTAQLENQLRIRNLKDMDIGQRAYANTDWTDPAAEQKAEQYMIQNGMSFKGIQDFRMNNATYRKILAESDKDVLGNEQTRNVLKADAFNAYDTAKPEDKPGVWPIVANQLNRFGYNLDPNTPPPDQIVKAGIALNTHQSELIGNELKARQADEAAARALKANQDRLLASQQDEREQAARSALPPGTPPEQVAMTAEQRAEMGIKGQELEVRKGELAKQTAALQDSIKRHAQQFAIESEREARSERMFNLTMAPLSDPNSPVYGVDTKNAMASKQAVAKADTEYNNALSSARTLNDFITQIQTGGPAAKAAARLLPTEGSFVLSTANGSHRINRQEVQAVLGTGDLYDRVAGKVKGALTGVEMTDDVLNSLSSLYTGIAGKAAQKHLDALRSVDKLYGTHWADKIAPPTPGGPTGGPQATHRFNPATGKIEAIP